MIQYFEDLLRQKTYNTQSSILYSQWGFDKILLPNALDAVANIFPHYSLHDRSHAETILGNIVRVLGKDVVERLSSIDIWLLVESAYCHDLGMIISGDLLNKTFDSREFFEYFNAIKNDPKNEFFEYVKNLSVSNGTIEISANHLPYREIINFRYVIAEFLRRSHADNSEKIINDPSGEISLHSPRVVIPQRIWKLLGKISAAHTQNFSDVMKLTYSEVGLDDEVAHPRFVACMLRIGDVLDLDNNRFSEVMLRSMVNTPISTIVHKQKHLSIESLHVDKERIAIWAKCSNYESAEAMQHWFEFINKEFIDQRVNWNSIAPKNLSQSLPSIDFLTVELEGFKYVDGKNRPRFSFDPNYALRLVKGTGLYSSQYQAIREILQNGIDSTLIRVWEENSNQIDVTQPNSPALANILQRYQTSLNIHRGRSNDENQTWIIEIIDHGIGISLEDLRFMMKAGSSSSNLKKRRVTDSMPIWLKPSGVFGIGFQSIFMLADKVNVSTKSIYSNEAHEFELFSPGSSMDGSILIRPLEVNLSLDYGTTVRFELVTKKIPDSYYVNFQVGAARRLAQEYDFFTSESFDIQIYNIIDEAILFSKKSNIPVNISIDDEVFFVDRAKKTFDFFDADFSYELNIKPALLANRGKVKTYFKGQEFDSSFAFEFLDVEINFHSPRADQLLSLNRNKLLADATSKVFENVLTSTTRVLGNHFDEICDSDKDRIAGSMFLHTYCKEGDPLLMEHTEWMLHRFSDIGNTIFNSDLLICHLTFGEVLERANRIIIFLEHDPEGHRSDKFSFNDDTAEFEITLYNGQIDTYTEFFLNRSSDVFKYLCVFDMNSVVHQVGFQKHVCDLPIDLSYIQGIFYSPYQKIDSFRCFIPAVEEFKKLRVVDKAFAPYVPRYRFSKYVRFDLPIMLSPYSGKYVGGDVHPFVNVNEKFFDWVYLNRADTSVSRDEIVSEYNRFISLINIPQIIS